MVHKRPLSPAHIEDPLAGLNQIGGMDLEKGGSTGLCPSPRAYRPGSCAPQTKAALHT